MDPGLDLTEEADEAGEVVEQIEVVDADNVEEVYVDNNPPIEEIVANDVEHVEIELLDDDGDDDECTNAIPGMNASVQSYMKRHILQTESTPPPFSLSWSSCIGCDDLSNKKETLYRNTLADLFERLIPYMEQAYEITLTRTLSESIDDPDYQIPSRMSLLSQVARTAVAQLESVANRGSVKRRKNNSFLTQEELMLLAEDALESWPSNRQHQLASDATDAKESATDSPFSSIKAAPTCMRPGNEDVVHSISDESDSDPIKIVSLDELPVEDNKVTMRRIKRDFETLKSKDDSTIGPTILENLECRVCFRFFKDIDESEALRAERAGEHSRIGDYNRLNSDEDTSMKYQIETSKCTIGGLWTTPCGHIFCRECLRDYFMGMRGIHANATPTTKQKNIKKPCPVCKSVCRYINCHKIYL